jgi:tetratricopeptide (TPR) repeat protein
LNRNYAEVVTELTQIPRSELLQSPQQAYLLADAARRVGGVEDIATLLGDIVAAARSTNDKQTLCAALNLHGIVLLDQGQAQAAERSWCDLVDVASAADDPQMVARASNNLGVVAILDMRLETAIANLQRASSAYLRLGYARGCAQVHQNMGIVFRELDHFQNAHNHFEQAMTYARMADCLDDVARAEQETALLMVYAREDLDSADAYAQNALERFSQLKQPAGTGEAMRVIGIVALAHNRREESRQHLTNALELGRALKLRLLEAEALLGLARLARTQNDAPASYTQQRQAEEIFAEIHAAPWGAQLQRRMDTLPHARPA